MHNFRSLAVIAAAICALMYLEILKLVKSFISTNKYRNIYKMCCRNNSRHCGERKYFLQFITLLSFYNTRMGVVGFHLSLTFLSFLACH